MDKTCIENDVKKKKICFVVSSPVTAINFLKRPIQRLAHHYDIYLVANFDGAQLPDDMPLIQCKDISIKRRISILNDLLSVVHLSRYFSKMSFDAVHSLTPKAGLICALSSAMACVPIRIHTFTGQVWANKRGIARKAFMLFDKMISKMNTHLLTDGHSQRDFLIANDVIKAHKSSVLGNGSICGADFNRFHPDSIRRQALRKQKNLSGKTVFAYLGRITSEKGIPNLLEAFDMVAKIRDDIFLILMGRNEEGLSDTFDDYANLYPGKNMEYLGLVDEPAYWLQCADVFVMPSLREGFGLSVIEAAAVGLPAIVSDTYGLRDTVIDGTTGLSYPTGNVQSLAKCIDLMASDGEMRQNMGQAALKRAAELYDSKIVLDAWAQFYSHVL